jgi:molybdopterin synthase catalytic subunit
MTADTEDYVLVGGKFVGCRLRDLSDEDLESYQQYRPYVSADLAAIRQYFRQRRDRVRSLAYHQRSAPAAA